MSARACPDDGLALAESLVAGARVHACGYCKGAWLPESGVRAVFERLPGDHSRWDRLYERVQREGRDSGLTCLDCDGRLMTIAHRDVEIEVCGACGGIWFDGGELRSLVTGKANPYARTAMAAGAGAAAVAAAGLAQAAPGPAPGEDGSGTDPISVVSNIADVATSEIGGSLIEGAISLIGDLFSGL